VLAIPSILQRTVDLISWLVRLGTRMFHQVSLYFITALYTRCTDTYDPRHFGPDTSAPVLNCP